MHTAARNRQSSHCQCYQHRATPAVCIPDRKTGSESPSSHLILVKQRADRTPASRNQPQQPRPQPRAAASIPRPCIDNTSPVVRVSDEQTPADVAHDSSRRDADSMPRTQLPQLPRPARSAAPTSREISVSDRDSPTRVHRTPLFSAATPGLQQRASNFQTGTIVHYPTRAVRLKHTSPAWV